MVVMDPKLPSPQSVGREFVRQYYTLLNQAPLHLHRFYSADSSFVHGGLDANEKTSEPVYGQQDIHQRIMQLNFRECKAKVRQVDAHHTIGQGVVVQVSGELSNQGQPMRRFMQTFVLAPQSAKKYYVHNDIFRYQDEVFSEDVQDESPSPIIDQGVTQVAENARTSPSTVDVETDGKTANNNNVASPKYKGTQPNIGEDGIPSVSINRSTPHVEQPPPANLNAVSPIVRGQEEKEPRVNGGNEHNPEKQIPEPVEEPKQADSEGELKSPEAPTPEVVNDVEVSAKSLLTQEVDLISDESDEADEAAPATENPGAPLSYALMAKQNAGNSVLTQQANKASVPGNAAIPIQAGSLPPAGFGKPSTPQQYSGSTSQQPKGGEVSKEGTPSPSGPTSFGNSKGGYSRGSGPNNRTGGGGGSGINRNQGAVLNWLSGGSQSGGQGGNRYNRDDDSNRDERRRGQNTVYPDTQRLFVGNLPHNCSEADLEDLFGQYGKVAEIRINSKGVMQSKTMASGQRIPNFGFVVFEEEQSVVKCLSHTPIKLSNGHRLNVEIKKNKQMRTESTSSGYQQSGPAGGGSGGGVGGGPAQSKGRGGGASGGNSSAGTGNFGGSQEQLGGGSRSGPWSRPGGQGGRGVPRVGGRGGGYGGDRSLSTGGSGRGGSSGSSAGGSSGASSHSSGSGTSNRAYVGPRRS